MAKVVLIQATPRNAATGATVAVRLAGGGAKAYDQEGFTDWRSGIVALPKFTSAIGFDQSGFSGAALSQIASMRFFSSDPALVDYLAGLIWTRAPVTVKIGDDEAAAPSYPVAQVGTVGAVQIAGGAVTFTITDLSVDLDAPAVPNSFAGTGGIEGGSDALGRVKRRSFGYCFNVEGRVLVKASNVFEFGDPSKPLTAMPLIKDKGRAASSATLVAWAGSIDATLAALIATAAPSGGCAYAPSIACVKWWTTPAGPLTADVIGEVSSSAIAPATLASYIMGAYQPGITFTNLATAEGWVNRPAGVHIDSASESIASVLDRLLTPVGLIWKLTDAGAFEFTRPTWTGPVVELTADTIRRETVYQPLRTRRVGYQKNHRIHTDSEISAALLEWADVGGANRPEDNATRNDDGANMLTAPLSLDLVTLENGAIIAAGPSIQLFTTNALGRWGPKVECRPGETLWHSYRLRSDGAGTETVNASYIYFDAAGAVISAVNLSSLSAPTLNSCNGVTTTITFSFVVPATAFFIQIYIERPVATGNSFFASSPYLGRSAPGATVGAILGVNVVDPDTGTVPPRDSMIPAEVIDARGIQNNATRGAILDANPAIGNFRLGDGSFISPDLVLTQLGEAAGYFGQEATEKAIFAAGQNTLFNAGFVLGDASISLNGFAITKDFLGNFVQHPIGTGGEFVLFFQRGVNCGIGATMTLSAFFDGVAGPNQYTFADIQWTNPIAGTIIGYSSTGINGGTGPVFMRNGTYNNARRSQTVTVPASTDGSGYTVAIIRIISGSDVPYVINTMRISKLKFEIGSVPTIWSDEATDGANLATSAGQIVDSRNLTISNSFGVSGLSIPCALADTVIGGQLYLTIGTGSYSFDGGVTVSYPSATLGPGPFGLFYHIWANVPVPGQPPASYDASPNLLDSLGPGKQLLGGVQARANAGAPPATGGPGGFPLDNGGGYYIPY